MTAAVHAFLFSSSCSDMKEEPKFIMSDLLDSTRFQVMMMIFTLTSFRGWRSEGGGVSSSSHPCKIKRRCIPVQPPSLGRHLSGNSSFPWVGGWYEAHLWISYHEVSLLSISLYLSLPLSGSSSVRAGSINTVFTPRSSDWRPILPEINWEFLRKGKLKLFK